MSTPADLNTAIHTLAQALADGRLTINPLEDGSGVVLDVDREQMMTMNHTGITIVQAIAEGQTSPDGILDAVTRKFDVDHEQARSDIERFVRDTAGLL